ncbi:slr0397 [Synechocystis sp. PCC 6803]|jgi:hypothetical protein|uniref:Slr0397 protein n=1 Tax=Synechocystis sp. (strain ATCC 27184 / PCC 6803 / Kazusa) TaxID=1111708 RepID=P74427_SYNY3|nr:MULTISPECIES: DUF3038 domain-containing protein [unclassified Synechocystis]BAM54746.1 hypothetical protein BEST7613_5815 [Synechocystis sp. PCC 6803] [Bacillus subtilis BEST7613]AGF52216.1 hypothetical protein MYO_119740 [Synechocystis sp. PCC 6803]ALJ68161.1 hypothetical protein AOY38_10155 [Synechocystis sp. PCC 6803]AVP90006.1 DUF3038 domain-containing protein [Synechocystis sp. IPPAS B-1465]MBD2617739.1 DUF3038 domain-containing protein [Synechocystis sp. FACHB-898]
MVLTQFASSPAPPQSFAVAPNRQQLRQMNCYLDQLLLALVALTDVDEDTWTAILEKISSSTTTGQSLTRKYPIPAVAPGQLDVEGIRLLAMAIAYLGAHYQELLRRSVSLVEQTKEQGKNPLQTVLLSEYARKFTSAWQAYGEKQGGEAHIPLAPITSDRLLSLLTELFFFSSQDGPRRLWGVLATMVSPA